MSTHDNDEPTELELEQQRAGFVPAREDDLFDRLAATSWLGGIDEPEQAASERSEDELIPDTDAERAAEHQRAATGRPIVRFLPSDLHHGPADGADDH